MKLILQRLCLVTALICGPLTAASAVDEGLSACFDCVLTVNERSYPDILRVSCTTSSLTPMKTVCIKGLGFPCGSDLRVELLGVLEGADFSDVNPEVDLADFWSKIRNVAPEYWDQNLDTLPIGLFMRAFDPNTVGRKYVFQLISTVPKGVEAEPINVFFSINNKLIPVYSSAMLLVVADLNEEGLLSGC